jgi:transposase
VVIAHFAEATKPKLRQMPDEMTRHLAGLVARRRQIVEMIAAEGQRARRMSDKRLIKSIARLRKALEKELSALDVLIGDQIRGSPVWAEKEDLLASVPGVGKTIARTLIAACRSLVLSTADRSRPLSGSRHGPASPDNGEARVSSAEAARACATLCSSAPWSLRVTTRSSKASATNLSPPESQSSSLSSPSPAS